MTSRERVMASLNHQQPDKVAIDFGGICNSTMHVGRSTVYRTIC